jgi:lysophospholipase L1-like esterase
MTKPVDHTPDHPYIRYTGRIDLANPQKPRLVGAGAYMQMKFQGCDCTIILEDKSPKRQHNYIAIELDGQYQGRIKVTRDRILYPVARDLADTEHNLLVCKATEAQNGTIDVSGVQCDELLPLDEPLKRRIEFIGDSITCGMGLDLSDLPCGSGHWYDRHNAYLAYGPIMARTLEAEWLLSSVSGIGMSRNWNSPGPIMPWVYNNLYLNTETWVPWHEQSFNPQLICICLGTNDFSDGDGTYERGLVDAEKFIDNYVYFIKGIRDRCKRAHIVCLTSPMLSGDKAAQLKDFLKSVVRHMRNKERDKRVYMFEFSQSGTGGCDSHPNEAEHQQIAAELLPFIKKTMNW